MSTRLFTPAEIEELRENAYVKKVTDRSVFFTDRFKEEFRQEYETGSMPTEILRGMGIDPKVLGASRVSGITQKLSTPKAKEQEKPESGKAAEKIEKNRTLYLEHEVELLRQEVLFLKKIMEADRETLQRYQLKRNRELTSGSSKK